MIRALAFLLLLLTGVPAASAAELDALEAEYTTVAGELATLARQAEATDQPRTRIDTIRALRAKVEDAKLRLAMLAGRLAALRDAESRLRVTVSRGDYGGAAIERALEGGDILAATAEFKSAGGAAIWRLLGQGDVPVPGAEKTEIVEAGETFQARFKIQVKDLPAGAYALTFDYRPKDGAPLSARHPLEIAAPLTELPRFSVVGRFDSPDAPLDRPVREGDTLAFTAEVPLVGHEGRGQVGLLGWQLYDGGDRPVPGATKAVQTYETGGVEHAVFRFKPAGLPDDDYTVALTHRLAAEGSASTMATSRFTFRQPVRIGRLVVSDSREGAENRPSLKSHQLPYMFAYFSLRPEVKEATVELVARRADGKVVAETSRTVTNKGGEQRLGMAPQEKLIAGDYEFVARLSASEGGSAEARQSFVVSDYALSIRAPNRLPSGDHGPFRIEPPGDFVAPLKISVEAGSGVIVSHAPGSLTGTVAGIAEGRDAVGRVRISVADSQGRTASGGFGFIIAAAAQPAAPSSGGGSRGGIDMARVEQCLRAGANDDSAGLARCRQWDQEAGLVGKRVKCRIGDDWKESKDGLYAGAYQYAKAHVAFGRYLGNLPKPGGGYYTAEEKARTIEGARAAAKSAHCMVID